MSFSDEEKKELRKLIRMELIEFWNQQKTEQAINIGKFASIEDMHISEKSKNRYFIMKDLE